MDTRCSMHTVWRGWWLGERGLGDVEHTSVEGRFACHHCPFHLRRARGRAHVVTANIHLRPIENTSEASGYPSQNNSPGAFGVFESG